MSRSPLAPIARRLLLSRRGLAVAALGVTLGVGATVTTLASWTTHQYVWGGSGATGAQPGQGSGGGLTTSKFVVELSTDGSSWADRSTTPGQRLSFTATAAALSPGVTTYAPVALRTAAGSTVGGTVTLAGATALSGTDAALFSALVYGAKSVASSGDCTSTGYAGATGGQLVVDGSSLTTASSTGALTLAAPTSSGAGGAPVWVCFALKLPQGVDASLSGRTTTPVWGFDAVSD